MRNLAITVPGGVAKERDALPGNYASGRKYVMIFYTGGCVFVYAGLQICKLIGWLGGLSWVSWLGKKDKEWIPFKIKIIRQDLQDNQDFFWPFSGRKWSNLIAFGELICA